MNVLQIEAQEHGKEEEKKGEEEEVEVRVINISNSIGQQEDAKEEDSLSSISVDQNETGEKDADTRNDHEKRSPHGKVGCGVVDFDHFLDSVAKVLRDDENLHTKNFQTNR